ncbi:MAG: YebC/PmpR family DNA-binding transcriptional regulator [Planctomycetota bacterium]|jgi:YebC/PmpR family DNA-binding regulatory protein|nr:MAG: YebC/PmpR family DNA-binding transcriptional regulator [Planctomycetota bacterium]
MAGHSHAKNIKHRKAAVDAKRGKAWSKCSRAIIVAAQNGGGDPQFNPSLRLAVDDARSANMPRDTIEKAIKKGTGEGVVERFEEARYEGYGPNGVAIIVEALITNANKVAADIRMIFDKNDGKIGVQGSVSFGFQQIGQIILASGGKSEDTVMEAALEAGATDVSSEEDLFCVVTKPGDLLTVREALLAAGYKIEMSEIIWQAHNSITIDAETATKVEKLIEALEDYDDVQKVHHNAQWE